MGQTINRIKTNTYMHKHTEVQAHIHTYTHPQTYVRTYGYSYRVYTSASCFQTPDLI